jgi:hypothetical protein
MLIKLRSFTALLLLAAIDVLGCKPLRRSWMRGEWLVMVPCVRIDRTGASTGGAEPPAGDRPPDGPASAELHELSVPYLEVISSRTEQCACWEERACKRTSSCL